MTTLSPQQAAWMAEQNAKQPRRTELFNLASNPADWKAPIEFFVPHGMNIAPAEFIDAIEHFTATPVTIEGTNAGYWVRSIGYRAGPAGG